MSKSFKIFYIATALFFVIILLETLVKEFNPVTFFIAMICWIPLLAIAIMNEQIIDSISLLYQYNIERDRELVKQIEQSKIGYPPAHAFIPVLSQCPANLDIKKVDSRPVIENQNIVAIEEQTKENVAVKKE
jgi:hypothetical protein